jgi:hypothetical protein
VALLGVPLTAQWLHYPTAGIPRTTDGKPNLSAPAPKTPDGKPDFSGMWQVPNPKYLQNLAADGVEVPMLPWAASLYKQRQEDNFKDRPGGYCRILPAAQRHRLRRALHAEEGTSDAWAGPTRLAPSPALKGAGKRESRA